MIQIQNSSRILGLRNRSSLHKATAVYSSSSCCCECPDWTFYNCKASKSIIQRFETTAQNSANLRALKLRKIRSGYAGLLAVCIKKKSSTAIVLQLATSVCSCSCWAGRRHLTTQRQMNRGWTSPSAIMKDTRCPSTAFRRARPRLNKGSARARERDKAELRGAASAAVDCVRGKKLSPWKEMYAQLL